jgi:hypothetical protein
VGALGPKLGIPLARLLGGAKDARLECGAVGAGAEGAYEGASEALDVFFCKGGCWLGRARDDTDGFLRSCSVEAGARSWGWLAADLSTGRRDEAGLGMPDGRGMEEGWSMAACNALDVAADVNGQKRVSSGVQTKRQTRTHWETCRTRRRPCRQLLPSGP